MKKKPARRLSMWAAAIFVPASLLSSCESAPSPAQTETVTPAPSPIAASPVGTQTTNPEIVFTEKEPDKTTEQIIGLIRSYQSKLAEAVNSGSFALIKPYLDPDAPLYSSQKSLVESLASRSIKEKFVSSDMYGYSLLDPDHFKAEIREVYEVDVPGKTPVVNEYHWYYYVKRQNGRMLLEKLEEWTSYNQDMMQREGSVKGDGYYADELLHDLPKVLETAVNQLDLTDIRDISANDWVFDKWKELLTGWRIKGSVYSVQSKIKEQDWNTLRSVVELTCHYIDRQNNNAVDTYSVTLQLKEIRNELNLHGYAVISYIGQDATGPLPEPDHSVLHREVASIREGEPYWLFQVYGKADSMKHDTNFSSNRVKIVQADAPDKVVQDISFEPTRTWDGSTLGLRVEDMNFDGYLDIRIQRDNPPGPNVPYDCWLWNPQTGSFERSEALEAIPSPEFDGKDRSIRSQVRESAAEYSDNTYRYLHGAPVLMKREVHRADPDKQVWHVTVQELQNNRLVETMRYDKTMAKPF